MLSIIDAVMKYFSSNDIVAWGGGGLDVLLIDLEIAHTLSQHNRGALLFGFQHTYAWRVYGNGNKAVLVS